MAEHSLFARSALGTTYGTTGNSMDVSRDASASTVQSPADNGSQHARYQETIGQITLAECEPTALVTIAFQASQAESIAGALQGACKLDWPTVGLSTTGAHNTRLMALQADQYWLSWPSDQPAADRTAGQWLGDVRAYLTDQSDGWASLEMWGESCQSVLERLCAVDLDEAQCPVNTAVRTTIEHTGALLIRLGQQRYRFITPQSSVQSLRHAIQSVAHHIDNELATPALSG